MQKDPIDIAVNARNYVEKQVKSLPGELGNDKEYFDKFLKGFDTAKEMADNEEKTAILEDTAVKVANQLSFILFRHSALSAEAEKEYRALPTAEATTEAVRTAKKSRDDENNELMEKNKAAQNKQKEIDVFMQVISGLSKEEAEKKIEDYIAAGGR